MALLSSLFRKKKKDNSVRIVRLDEVDSTNNYLRSYHPGEGEKMTVAVADYQTAGRGQGTNTWESERGKNLTFSILLHPVMVPLQRQFLLSMMGGIALKMALANYTDGITLKWPNDVYWNDRKLSGTLIETTVLGGHINNCIFGIGLNVNQAEFHSDAPNPVSLLQILGHEVDREQLLQEIIKSFQYCYSLIENGDYTDVAALYHDSLYRQHGFHSYRDKDGVFEAAIVEVEDNGHLILRDREGAIREYEFKEIAFNA
ncbi:MAG: biotin--[acetyl-CoA-carboxylase] ligase [Prevotella sp.]|jgi:BirA family biotin operon repressor/biotin-[acetyl-CoA-carboxylase] ligase